MAKSIVEKLNLKKYKKKAVLHLPLGADYFQELTDYDQELNEDHYDLIFAFVLDMEAMKEIINRVIEEDYLGKNGYLFLAYPKKGNKHYSTYIHRDDIFPEVGVNAEGYVGNSNIKFSRMVGLDDIFTVVGLKEASKEKNKTSNKASQCVDDYIEKIPQVEKDLQDNSVLLSFYQSLSDGYRKDWARYVYSAKQEATKEKRRGEMKKILKEGYKSRDLYLRDKR